MSPINRLLCISIVASIGLIIESCQSPIIGGCFLPNANVELFESFTTGYRNDVDSIHLAFIHTDPSKKSELSYTDPESAFNWNYPKIYPSAIGSNTDFAIGIDFSFQTYRLSQYNAGDENSNVQKTKLATYSKQYGDTNFKRMVSPLTFKYKGPASGRVVLEEQIKSIHIVCGSQYAHFSPNQNINSAFILAYANPLGTASKHQRFDASHAGNDYSFVPFGGCSCEIGGIEKAEYDEQNNLFKTRFPEPYQWYDGEYFPCVQYQDLSEVDFAEIPHISAMVALIPKVFPTVPGDYSFTIEVEFTNGKILRTTTPPIGFSGL